MTTEDIRTTAESVPGDVPRRRGPRGWWRAFGRPPRIMGLDAARALAVLGMVGAHIGVTGELDLLDPGSWGAIVHGRSSILFAVLAGISIALMTGRTRRPEREDLPRIRLSLLGRGAAIFLIGLVLELLNTPIAVILTVYGLLYAAAVPFLRWRPSRLLLASGVLAIAGPPALAALQAVSLGASGPGLGLVLFGTYPITVWMAFVLAGLAIGRMRLQRVRTATWLLLTGAVISTVGYGVGVAADAAGAQGGSSWIDSAESSSSSTTDEWGGSEGGLSSGSMGVPPEDVDFTGTVCDAYGDGTVYCYPPGLEWASEESGEEASGWASYASMVAGYEPLASMGQSLVAVFPHSGGTAEILGSGGFAVAVIAVCLLAARPLRWVMLPLAALGSMPLSAYSAHILAIVAIVGPGGFLSGNAEWGWFSLALVAAATLWAVLLGRGPLERLVGRAAQAMADAGRRESGRHAPGSAEEA
ncbi:heparan-alpha-glucosaminide N-acetyltransferase domain-containing protein [Microbacterium tumbae]